MQKSEKEILKLIAKNDARAALPKIYEVFGEALYSTCCCYMSNDDLARDALHDTFIAIFQEISNLSKRKLKVGELMPLLNRVAVCESLKLLNDELSTHSFFGFESEKELLQVEADEEESEEDILPTKLSAEVLQSILRQMPVQQRTVLNLYVLEQMSHKEIADQLCITCNSSIVALHRAKQTLKHLIVKHLKK